jgi:hypothetical protein
MGGLAPCSVIFSRYTSPEDACAFLAMFPPL